MAISCGTPAGPVCRSHQPRGGAVGRGGLHRLRREYTCPLAAWSIGGPGVGWRRKQPCQANIRLLDEGAPPHGGCFEAAGGAYHDVMLEPRIQYTRTSDGVNLAYTSFGEGGVAVVALRPPQLSHIGLEFDLPFQTRYHEFERMAETMQVVRFDSRGAGLSDREVADISLEARIRDIDAVADRLGLGRVALQAKPPPLSLSLFSSL